MMPNREKFAGVCLSCRLRNMLTPHIDGELEEFDRQRLQKHLERCARCRAEHERLLFASRMVSLLELPDQSPAGRKSWSVPVASQSDYRQRAWRILTPVTAAILLVASVLFVWHRIHQQPVSPLRAPDASWGVVRLSGAPSINSDRIGRTSELKPDDWLETDKNSRAMLNLGIMGQIEVDPDTRIGLVTLRPDEQKLAMTRGRIFATIMAPPRVFTVETPSAVAVDLGCSYSLEVDDAGESALYVASGSVALADRGREIIVPTDAICISRPGSGPGTPYSESASKRLQQALRRFDFENGGSQALKVILAEARASDAHTLWSLLTRVEGVDRDHVYAKLAAIVSPPTEVTRDGILGLDQQMLGLWLRKLDEVRAGRHSRLAPGSVRLTGNMEVDRSWHRATLLRDGRVLVTGGFDSYGNALSSAEIYDPSTGHFIDAGNMTSRRATHSATMLPNGKVLIAGGCASTDPEALASAEIYDPDTSRFTATGDLQVARVGHEATLLADGRVLITGGLGSGAGPTELASAEIYDPGTGTFTTTGSMHERRVDHSTTLLGNGTVLVAGGLSVAGSAAKVTSSAEIFDPARGVFTVVGGMSFRRYKHSAVLLNDGRVLIAGGIIPEPGARHRYTTAELYDPAKNSFIKTGDMILDRFKVKNASVLLGSGKVLIVGGSWGYEVYDPVTGEFSLKTDGLTMMRYYSTATLLTNGQVVIIGGYSGIKPVDYYHSSAGAWIYDPE